ncbi:serine hydrolase domain-containing protein [Virgibacillus sp. W0430]|uniref:serine hydrolase domain-containing protein n=1 Tax=Virgibacillus sp. W0430 TaxID=3391580 RepID=UPI003F48DA7C
MRKFEDEAKQLLTKYHVPGCIMAISYDGKIVYKKTFGYKNVEYQEKIDGDTVFGLASLTKSFTCVAIMQLVEQGKIDINEPITHYIPHFNLKNEQNRNKITVYHLMTHSSGLPPLPSLDYAMVRKRNNAPLADYLELPKKEERLMTYKQLMDSLATTDIELLDRPGELFSYSNDGYGLLGAIIENVSGMSYEQFVLKNIIHPCGMTHTFFTVQEDKTYPNMTTCYEEYNEEVYVAQHWWDAPAMRATGFLKSTANDMMSYTSLFINEGVVNGKQILTKESVKQMVIPHIKMDPVKFYGYGLEITPNYFGQKLVQHGGSLQSISSNLAIIPEKKVAAIILSNLSGFPANRLMAYALNSYFGREINEEHFSTTEFNVTSGELALYEGKYCSSEGMVVTLKVIEGNKVSFFYKEKAYPITFIRKNVFLAYINDAIEPGEFLVDQQNSVYGISIYHRVLLKNN